MQVLPACRGVHRRRARGGHEPREPAKGKEGSPPSYVYPDSDDGPDEGKDKKPAPPAGSKKLVQPAGPPPLTPLVDALAGFYEGQARFMPYCRQGSNPRRLRSAVAPESQQGPVPPEVEEIDQLSLCRAAFHHTSWFNPLNVSTIIISP